MVEDTWRPLSLVTLRHDYLRHVQRGKPFNSMITEISLNVGSQSGVGQEEDRPSSNGRTFLLTRTGRSALPLYIAHLGLSTVQNYLGHSVNAPTGRWQKNKDVHWYNRDVNSSQDERAEEIRKIKEAEADALAVALGFAPAAKTGDAS